VSNGSVKPEAREPAAPKLRLDRFDAEFSSRTTPGEWERILSVRDHPRYLDGVALYNEIVPAVFAGNFVLSKAVTQISRFQTIVLTLHLHDTADAADPTTGLTLSRLQRLCKAHKLASPGSVTAFLGVLLVAGYLRRQRSDRDRRVIHLEPTEKFIAIVETWNRAIARSLDAIEPEMRLTEAHSAHARFGWDMRERGAQFLLAGWKPLEPFPEAMHFVAGDGGWMMLCHCVAEILRRGERREIVPVAVDLTAFGRRFGVSRSHLRRMLESAYQKGLLVEPPRNGRHVLMSERLLASCLSAQAFELGTYRACAHAVQRTLVAKTA
jgi:hypothetical protein